MTTLKAIQLPKQVVDEVQKNKKQYEESKSDKPINPK